MDEVLICNMMGVHHTNSGEGSRASGRKEDKHRVLRVSVVLLGARANTITAQVGALRRYETWHNRDRFMLVGSCIHRRTAHKLPCMDVPWDAHWARGPAIMR